MKVGEFKIGDRVKCIDCEVDDPVQIGELGTLLEDDDAPRVKWDNGASCPMNCEHEIKLWNRVGEKRNKSLQDRIDAEVEKLIS